MKKYEITKEFIKEAHKSACSDWKAKIEKEFPDAFKNHLEVGLWYKDTYGRLFVPTKILNKKECQGYGFGCIKKEFLAVESLFNWEINGYEILATPKEVEDALIKEAVKRGFVSGATIDNSNLSSDCGQGNLIKEKTAYKYQESNNTLWIDSVFNYRRIIFEKGVWATIIPQPKEVLITMEEIAKLKGCSVEQLKIMK